MDSNIAEISFQDNLDTEIDLQKLKDILESMERTFEENKKQINDLKSKLETAIDKLEITKSIVKFYEHKCDELTAKAEDVYWRQIKAQTVLQTEEEFVENYVAKLGNPTYFNETIESPSLEMKLMELKKNKEDLEREVVKNNKTIEKLNNDHQQLKEECELLKQK